MLTAPLKRLEQEPRYAPACVASNVYARAARSQRYAAASMRGVFATPESVAAAQNPSA